MARLLTQQEAMRRKVKYQVFAGMFDFLAVVVGVLLIIGCVLLLSSLVRWVMNDVPVTFREILNFIEKAIVVPE